MSTQPHIVILGGAYAGLSALNNLISLSSGKAQQEPQRGGPPRGGGGNNAGQGPPGPPVEDPASKITRALHNKPRYTLIDERDGFYHTVGAPLGQISPSFASEFWVKYDDIIASRSLRDVTFIQGAASGIDLKLKVLKYSSPTSSDPGLISYDFLIVATGMRRGAPVVPQAISKKLNTLDAEDFENELSQYSNIVLVGGGAVGIEMSAELKIHFPQCNVTLVHSRDRLLSAEPLPDEFKDKALDLVREAGAQVILGERVVGEKKTRSGTELSLTSGQTLLCDKVIYTATQTGANAAFLPTEILDDKGCIRTRDTLQFPEIVPNADSHYAAGDVVSWDQIKRSGPAQAMGKLAATNIVLSMLAAEDHKPTAELGQFPHGKSSMSLAVGDQAVTMRMGIKFGKEIKQRAFGRGLGIEGTLAKLQLSNVGKDAPVEERPRVENIANI